MANSNVDGMMMLFFVIRHGVNLIRIRRDSSMIPFGMTFINDS